MTPEDREAAEREVERLRRLAVQAKRKVLHADEYTETEERLEEWAAELTKRADRLERSLNEARDA